MREDLVKLKILRDTLIGLEMDVSMAEKELEIITTDIHYMEIAESTLKENLNILKRERVIAMASQYKKSIQELSHIHSKIKTYRVHATRLEKRLDELVRRHKVYLEDYKAQKKFVEGQKVILFFDPKKRRKKGSNEG